jgi:hypothetical protein
MAQSKTSDWIPEFPKQSAVYMAICLIGLICFLIIAVVPNQRELSALDEEISRLSLELRKQEVLSPVFK